MKIDHGNVRRAIAVNLPESSPDESREEYLDRLADAALDAVFGPRELRPSNDRGQRWPQAMDVPADWITEAERMGLTRERARVEAERFVDYWISEPGAKGRKVNWRATWRNWIRRVLGDRVVSATHAGRTDNVRY